MKLFHRTFAMALMLGSIATTTGSIATTTSDCTNGPREVLAGSNGQGFETCSGNVLNLDPQQIPVDILSVAPDGSSVTFEVNQNFADSLVSRFAVLYDPNDQHSTCDVTSDVSVDWVSQEYTAHCGDNGLAEVKIFLYLCGDLPNDCDYCEPLGDKEDYFDFTFSLECAPLCTDPPTASPVAPPSGSQGDPHFKTWANEHYEYHGQCDMVLARDESFADGLGLDIQIRTKLVRFWSYIKNAAIRIGNDILEVQGGSDQETHYWINLEHKGPLTTVGGFPARIVSNDNGTKGIQRATYEIDLSSKYPGQKIVISTFKEFVRVDLQNASFESFGNTVGMLGDFATGDTLARDGVTILDDFVELGNEWQVLQSDDMLFHITEKPQFPQRCIEPEDPRGDRRRRRRLGESTISEEDAEKACSNLADPLDRKDCVYDTLATQDLDMVGAF